MSISEKRGDFESCKIGWIEGQALCACQLNLFFDVEGAKVIEVIPKRRSGVNRVRISANGVFSLKIDGEHWNLYRRTVIVAEHWIHLGYEYVQIEVIE